MKLQKRIDCAYEISRSYDPISDKKIIDLIINCEKCPYFSKNREYSICNNKCFKNLVKIFIQNPNLTQGIHKTINGIIKLTDNQIELISNYSKQLITFFLRIKIPVDKEKKDCIKKAECAHKRQFFFERIFGNKFNDGLILIDPILTYTEVTQEIMICNQLLKKRFECQDCFKVKIQFLKKIRDLLSETLILKKYLSFYDKHKDLSEIYSLIFADYNIIPKNFEKKPTLHEAHEQLVSSYKNGPYEIKIIEDLQSKEFSYKISTIIENSNLRKIYDKLIHELKNRPKEYFNYNKPLKLNELLLYEINYVNHLIKQEYEYLSNEEISDLAELTVFELLNFNPFMALLIDNEIEEIFLDSPKSHIYLDHRQFGRCQTDLSFTPTEIASFKTRIRLEAEHRLDETKPFLKKEIITRYFHIRVSIQIYPLSIDGFSMNIRKLQKNYLTIIDLIKNGTLTIEAAAYLLFNFIHGRCILVIGEPYSGKTTLINSIDLLGKKSWRKIYIEDVIESIDQSSFQIHQVRFQVDPFSEKSKNNLMKSFQVKECLHRTPDVIFIGEIIHSPAAESFFFLLKVGLRRCLATAHGESPELMVERFLYDDKIPSPLIANLDILVQMNRIEMDGRIIRRVTRIIEIQKKTQSKFIEGVTNPQINPNFKFIDIFLRNPKNDQLIISFHSLNELYENSETLNKINLLRGEYISKKDLQYELENIQSTIENLFKNNHVEISEIIKSFHTLWQSLEHKICFKELSKSNKGVEYQ